VEIDASIMALGFVQEGLGVALVDGLVPWSGFPGVTIRPFLPTVPLPVSLLISARRPLSQTQEILREEVRSALGRYAASPAAADRLHPA
jgi:hypothetical protein